MKIAELLGRVGRGIKAGVASVPEAILSSQTLSRTDQADPIRNSKAALNELRTGECSSDLRLRAVRFLRGRRLTDEGVAALLHVVTGRNISASFEAVPILTEHLNGRHASDAHREQVASHFVEFLNGSAGEPALRNQRLNALSIITGSGRQSSMVQNYLNHLLTDDCADRDERILVSRASGSRGQQVFDIR